MSPQTYASDERKGGPVADPVDNPAAVDAMAVLTECRARVLEREGIPMFIAVDDRRPGRRISVVDETALTHGVRLSELFDDYDRQLAALGYPPDPNDDDPDETGTPELIDSLVVLSDRHLRAREAG